MDNDDIGNNLNNYYVDKEYIKMPKVEIQDILFWILFILGIMVVLWILLGKSPTIEQGLLILILTMTIKNSTEIKGLKSDFKNLENKFNSLATDFKNHIKHK